MTGFDITQQTLIDIGKLPVKRRRAAMAALGQMEYARCAEDFFYWVDERRHPVTGPYVHTIDPHPLYLCSICKDDATHFFNKRNAHLELKHSIRPTSELETRGYFIELPTVRPFPIGLMDEYGAEIAKQWLEEKYLFVEKSRDMFATWMIVTLYTWDTLYHPGRQNIFQSQDASKTDELVKRAYDIWDNQPKFLKVAMHADYQKGSDKSGVFRVPAIHSEILGFPQGPDQIRQYHPSGVFMDEAAFQALAGDAFAAIKPAIQQGGRFTAISSANPSWFYLACSDRDQEAYSSL